VFSAQLGEFAWIAKAGRVGKRSLDFISPSERAP
jgi:hypothetical protein